MIKRLQKQLEHQRQLLHLELPPQTSRLVSKLLKRGYETCDYDLNCVNNGNIEMGALPSPASETARVAVKEKLTTTKRNNKEIENQFFNIFYLLSFDLISFYFRLMKQLTIKIDFLHFNLCCELMMTMATHM